MMNMPVDSLLFVEQRELALKCSPSQKELLAEIWWSVDQVSLATF